MKVQEFIDFVNNYENPFISLYDVYDSVDEKRIATIDVDTHRHYSIATDVYRCSDGFVGVTGLHEIFSEQSFPSDFNISCEASEYEEVQTITYQPKK